MADKMARRDKTQILRPSPDGQRGYVLTPQKPPTPPPKPVSEPKK
jgi:hypothetical protein